MFISWVRRRLAVTMLPDLGITLWGYMNLLGTETQSNKLVIDLTFVIGPIGMHTVQCGCIRGVPDTLDTLSMRSH